MLGHAESWSYTLTKPGEYSYMCTPHPYMRAKIIVREKLVSLTGTSPRTPWWAITLLLAGAVLVFGIAWYARRLTAYRTSHERNPTMPRLVSRVKAQGGQSHK
jgi:hypothetical protein